MKHKLEIEIDDLMWKALGRLSSVTLAKSSEIIQTMFDVSVVRDFGLLVKDVTKSYPELLDFPEIRNYIKELNDEN